MTKFLRFEPVAFIDVRARKRTRNVMTLVMVAILVPSTISAVQMIRVNQFEQKVQQFVKENRIYGGRYLYEYKVNGGWTPTADIYLTGDPLNETEKGHPLPRSLGLRSRERAPDPPRAEFRRRQGHRLRSHDAGYLPALR